MNYKVLYRKYRPSLFNDVVDQDYIIKTLKESVINNKISHAYIFSGPKGTGKTSTAKILAKAINCENLNNGEPCNKCSSCLNFDSNPDIIELDAASNNKVEDIREIVNNVRLLPNTSKYKIYIIDEAHMLTNSASNAFLLTLEEPPKHVIFILATTNPENLPQTILSRCQHFSFSRISNNKLKEQLSNIVKKENIKISEEAINEIVVISGGGLRDALSVLDQLNSMDEDITPELIRKYFGSISDIVIIDLIDSILKLDLEKINNIIDNFIVNAVSENYFISRFIKISSEKMFELKKNNFFDKIEILKRIIDNVILSMNYKLNENYFYYLKSVIYSLLPELPKKSSIIDHNNISQEIKNEIDHNNNLENNIENEAVLETKTNVENKNDNVVAELNNDAIDNNFIDSIVKIRINNSFCNASKQFKNQFTEKFNLFINENKNDGEMYSLLVDTCVGVVSDKNAVIVCESNSLASLLNVNNKILSLLEDNLNKKIVFIDKEKWISEQNKYKENIKNKNTYEYIDEPTISSENNELVTIGKDIFGDENIIVEE